MKLAEQWGSSDPALCTDSDCTEAEHIAWIRQIQADALRYAANLSGEERNTFLLALADQLDPSLPKLEPNHKGCRHDTI